VCQELDNEFLNIAKQYNLKAGSTLLLSMVKNDKFTISNIGDSICLLLKQNGEMRKLTNEQTPNREDEHNRILQSNGLITMKNGVARVDGSIAVSRAIGDIQYKQFLISEPETETHQIQPDDDLLILSTDGLFMAPSYKEQDVA